MIKSKADMYLYINLDRESAGLSKKIKPILYDLIYTNLINKYLTCLRKIEYYNNIETKWGNIISHILLIKLHKLSYKLGFYIPINVFGPGLYIPHFGSIVVNPKTRVGKNCILHANVVIGHHEGKTPTIGDNVFIGPGAKIFGDINIADNVWIGANAVVTKDISEPNAVVGGIPAKIIGYKKDSWNNTISKG